MTLTVYSTMSARALGYEILRLSEAHRAVSDQRARAINRFASALTGGVIIVFMVAPVVGQAYGIEHGIASAFGGIVAAWFYGLRDWYAFSVKSRRYIAAMDAITRELQRRRAAA